MAGGSRVQAQPKQLSNLARPGLKVKNQKKTGEAAQYVGGGPVFNSHKRKILSLGYMHKLYIK